MGKKAKIDQKVGRGEYRVRRKEDKLNQRNTFIISCE